MNFLSNADVTFSILQIRWLSLTLRQHTDSRKGTLDLKFNNVTALLCRAVEFIREFLFEFMLGTPDLGTCAGNAYAKTLRKYHGMVVRGVFAVSTLSVDPFALD